MDVSAFIPAGCLEGVFDTPLPGYQAIHVLGKIRRRPQMPPGMMKGHPQTDGGALFVLGRGRPQTP